MQVKFIGKDETVSVLKVVHHYQRITRFQLKAKIFIVMGARASHWFVPEGSDFIRFHYLPPACMDFLLPVPSSRSVLPSLNILPIVVFREDQ